jgi:hypothetical protein
MKEIEFLDTVNIGSDIRTEMERQHLTARMFADKSNTPQWILTEALAQKDIKVNLLIDFSYTLEIDLFHNYLQYMPLFDNHTVSEDEMFISIQNGQATIIPSKRCRTADFTQLIHIGNLLKDETERQNISRKHLSKILCCEISAIRRMFLNPNIGMERLVKMSYILNYDFIRRVYMPYMAVNKSEPIANDYISDALITINPKTVSIAKENEIVFYQNYLTVKKNDAHEKEINAHSKLGKSLI